MRRIFVLGFLFALGGCSSMTDLLSFGGNADEEPVVAQAAAPVAAAAAAPDDSMCQRVAIQDANSNGFDDATQKKVAVQSYTQCRAIFNK